MHVTNGTSEEERGKLSNGPVIKFPSFRHRCYRGKQGCRRQFVKASEQNSPSLP